LMEQIDPKDWGKAGMAICFLGRETCRPTKPKCEECVMVKVCAHTKTL
jgi:endonuclease-3